MSEPKRIVIVGGVAGGASAAARARRLSERAEILLFERGEHISFANCGLPYHIGGSIPERDRLLVVSPELMRRRFRIDVRVRSEVVRIDRDRKEVSVVDHATGREYRERYDALVLSPGAAPVRPPIPGVGSPLVHTLRNLADMDAILSDLDERRPGRALVVGGGYVGLEMAEAFRDRGLDVTLVELADQVMAAVDPEMASLVHQELRLNGVDLRLGTSVAEFVERDGSLDVLLSSGETVSCGLAVLAIGVRPEVDLARDAGLRIGELGGIVVDPHLRTSDPDIYAVGDAIEVSHLVDGRPALIPLAGPANRQGRIAADNLFGRESTYRGTQGTAICKVFNLAVAVTGLNEKALRKSNSAYEKIYVHPASHAGYYPGASPISLKLLFHPESGKLLGGQAVGTSGVDKRIDVLATALRAGLTVFDLEHLELAYAPPYGLAKDVVNYAGFVAANVLRGDAALCHTEDVLHIRDDQLLLDVRTHAELSSGTIPGARHIPLDELRDRMGELPRDKELLVFCGVGLRGYVACRILCQHGFRCRNLSGGLKTYRMATGHPPKDPKGPKDMHEDTGVRDDALAASAPAPEPPSSPVVKTVDAGGLQCPGPIQKLTAEIETLDDGQALTITATDPAFAADLAAWCRTTGHSLLDLVPDNGGCRATVLKRPRPSPAGARTAPRETRGLTIVLFSDDFDRAMAAFIIANGAAAMGFDVTMFFTFWGLGVLRRDRPVRVKKNLVERLFGRMMPRGPRRLALSKMNMAGMGRAMIDRILRKKNVAGLPELMADAARAGVRMVACSMSMNLLGLRREELIDGVEEGGVAVYLDRAGEGTVNLFI